MNTKSQLLFLTLVVALVAGCSTTKFHATAPNGSSPAKAHAPHASINDSDVDRKGWNHGNSVLWVFLPADGKIVPDDVETDGSMRAKFAWWRGVPGNFTITGHRLDGKAPPLRSKAGVFADFGLTPGYLYFPTPGYWEITGQIQGRPPLTFIVYCKKFKEQ
jgi:hypothetical protein